MNRQIKILGKVKAEQNGSAFLLATLVANALPFTFLGEGNMRKAWVEKNLTNHSFVVKSGKVTPFGFVGIKKLDTFSSLKDAEKKAETSNYIFGRLEKYIQGRKK